MTKTYYKVETQKGKHILVEVEIKSFIKRFGRKDCLIKPVSGMGEIYVTQESLIVKK
jgi:hypothetical protein